MDYHRSNRVNVRIVRIFNTYGPRMHPYDGRVISNFIRQALQGEDITIFGDGRQTRSFCYRDDLVEGLIRMMNAADDFSGPVNLGNPEEFTIRELADIVLEMTASAKSVLVVRPLPTIPRSGGRTSRCNGSAGLAADSCFAPGPVEDDRLVPLDRPFRVPPAHAELLIWSAAIYCRFFMPRSGFGGLLSFRARVGYGIIDNVTSWEE